jgi:hypothetical protein
MNWRESITATYAIAPKQAGIASKPEFYPGASAQEIADVEVRLNASLPASLRSLLLESNGVMGMMSIDGGDWFEEHWLIWTLEEVFERNLWYRDESAKETYQRDFRKVVFFADAGSDGVLFGFPITENQACAPNIVVWCPVEDKLQDLASSVEDFIKKWLTSTIWV